MYYKLARKHGTFDVSLFVLAQNKTEELRMLPTPTSLVEAIIAALAPVNFWLLTFRV